MKPTGTPETMGILLERPDDIELADRFIEGIRILDRVFEDSGGVVKNLSLQELQASGELMAFSSREDSDRSHFELFPEEVTHLRNLTARYGNTSGAPYADCFRDVLTAILDCEKEITNPASSSETPDNVVHVNFGDRRGHAGSPPPDPDPAA